MICSVDTSAPLTLGQLPDDLTSGLAAFPVCVGRAKAVAEAIRPLVSGWIEDNYSTMTNSAPQRQTHRSDPAVPAFDDSGPCTVMDAKCGVCARGARWIARNDRKGEFRIIPMQSPLGAALLRHYGMSPEDPSSWLYLADGQAFVSAEAIIRLGQRLGGRWRGLVVLRLLPRGARDWLYQRLARNRYRISRPVDLCSLPDPDVQRRLLQ